MLSSLYLPAWTGKKQMLKKHNFSNRIPDNCYHDSKCFFLLKFHFTLRILTFLREKLFLKNPDIRPTVGKNVLPRRLL